MRAHRAEIRCFRNLGDYIKAEVEPDHVLYPGLCGGTGVGTVLGSDPCRGRTRARVWSWAWTRGCAGVGPVPWFAGGVGPVYGFGAGSGRTRSLVGCGQLQGNQGPNAYRATSMNPILAVDNPYRVFPLLSGSLYPDEGV